MSKYFLVLTLGVTLLMGAQFPYNRYYRPNSNQTQRRPVPLRTAPKAPTTTKRPDQKSAPSSSPLVTQGGSQPVDIPDWTKVTPVGGGFAVFMPEEPAEKKQKVTAGNDQIELTQYVVSPDDHGAYVVMYSKLPRDRNPNDEIVLRSARQRVVDRLGGELINESDVMAGDHSGREIQVKTPGGSILRERMFINGDRFYQVIAAGSRDFVSSTEVGQYLRSFRFQRTKTEDEDTGK